MDVRANPGAHRARMDVRANPGAFYAPFLFAPTIAALRPHHIGRIPAHDVRRFYSPLRLPRHDRIGRFPHAFVIDTRCRGTLGANQQYP